jgi:four helix bundle protein
MPFPFEKLDVYQKALAMAEHVHGACDAFPAKGSFALADHLRRLAVAIPGEIAAASAVWPRAERRDAFAAARAQALACVPALEVAARRGLLPAERKAELLAEAEAIARMIGGMLKGMEGDGPAAPEPRAVQPAPPPPPRPAVTPRTPAR